jgi:exosortase/archaeosortase
MALSLPHIDHRAALARRIAACAALVILAHALPWVGLQRATATAVQALLGLAGLTAIPVGAYSLRIGGALYEYGVSCTFVDVIAGAIPLLWARHASLFRNLARMLGVVVALLTFNVVRLCLAQLLHARGLAWNMADGVLGGICYFLVLTWIIHRRAWSSGSQRYALLTP